MVDQCLRDQWMMSSLLPPGYLQLFISTQRLFTKIYKYNDLRYYIQYDTQSVLTPGHLQSVISTQEIYELKQMPQITSLQSLHLKMMPNVVPKLGNLCWWWCHPVAKFASIKCRLRQWKSQHRDLESNRAVTTFAHICHLCSYAQEMAYPVTMTI